jgi:hypothetical protein
VLLGVEDVFRRDPLVDGNSWGVNVGRFGVQFEQWTLAGAPHHEVYCRMSKYIRCAALRAVLCCALRAVMCFYLSAAANKSSCVLPC